MEFSAVLLEILVENQSDISVESEMLKEVAEYVWSEERGREGEISIALVGDEAMAELNNRFRSLDGPTDVLAFDLSEENRFVGEVVIAPEVAMKQAADAGISTMEEIRQLLIHGLLHLLGYSHDAETKAADMFDRQERLRLVFTSKGRTRYK